MLSILIGHSCSQRFDSKRVERDKPYAPLVTLLRDQGPRYAHLRRDAVRIPAGSTRSYRLTVLLVSRHEEKVQS